MKIVQIRNGNSHDKAMPFLTEHELARTKTNQLKNLARLCTINPIGLMHYLKTLSSFVDDFTDKKKKMNSDNPATVSNDIADTDDM